MSLKRGLTYAVSGLLNRRLAWFREKKWTSWKKPSVLVFAEMNRILELKSQMITFVNCVISTSRQKYQGYQKYTQLMESKLIILFRRVTLLAMQLLRGFVFSILDAAHKSRQVLQKP